MTERTDAELVGAAILGDEAAFGNLAARYRSAAFGVAFHKLGDFESARDAAQDALVRAFLELSTLREPEKFASWFYRIAQTTALAALRRRKITVSLDPDIAEANHRVSERAEEVREALETLPEADRLTVILHYVDGYSHEEIGLMTGASVPSVKSRIHRARRRLREEMLMTVEKSLKDERNPDIMDLGIGIDWLGIPCECRCRHCLFESGNGHKSVPLARAKAVAEKFVAWKESSGLANLYVDITLGYTYRLSEYEETQAFNRKHGTTSTSFFINGQPFLSDEELHKAFQRVAELGGESISLTFYGLRESHDRFAGRTGDFDFLLRAAKLSAEYGLARYEGMFFSKTSANELPELVKMLDSLPGKAAYRGIWVWDYRGRGKELENERPTIEDLERLPDSVKQYVKLAGWKPLKPESEWIKLIASGDYAKKKSRYYIIPAWEENIDWLESTDCETILSDIREKVERLHQAIPSLATLASLYGKKNGKKLYTLRDLEWKWTDLHLKAHPEIDPEGRYNDLMPTIMWH